MKGGERGAAREEFEKKKNSGGPRVMNEKRGMKKKTFRRIVKQGKETQKGWTMRECVYVCIYVSRANQESATTIKHRTRLKELHKRRQNRTNNVPEWLSTTAE